MKDDFLVEVEVMEKLMNLNTDLAGKGSCLAWTTFPYNEINLKIVEDSLKKINWDKNEYILTHDENLIFVEKDLL